MSIYALGMAIGLPLLLTAAAIVIIRLNREQERKSSDTTWHDRSLDDWRRERDARVAVEREQRVAARGDDLAAGSEEQGADPVRQQRIGG